MDSADMSLPISSCNLIVPSNIPNDLKLSCHFNSTQMVYVVNSMQSCQVCVRDQSTVENLKLCGSVFC